MHTIYITYNHGVFKAMKLKKTLLIISAVVLFSSFAPMSKSPKPAELERQIARKNGALVGRSLKALSSPKEIKRLSILANKHNYQPLKKAILSLTRGKSACRSLGINEMGYLHTAFYIETKLPQTRTTPAVIPWSIAGRKCTLSYDPETHNRFISLDDASVVGHGSKKVVTRALLYDAEQPRIVAKCDQRISISAELEKTRAVAGSPGLVDMKGYVKNKKTHTMFCKLYRNGSLKGAVLEGTEGKFSLNEKLHVAHQLLSGLTTLQEKGIIHRDMCLANCFLDISKHAKGKRDITAVIADLGSSRYLSEIGRSSACGHAAYTSPEGMFTSKLTNEGYFKTDIFAMGTIFYCLFYEKQPKWLEENYKRTASSHKEAYKKVLAILEKTTEKRKDSLHKKGAKSQLNKKERFEALILKMLSIEPEERGTPAELKATIEAIIKS